MSNSGECQVIYEKPSKKKQAQMNLEICRTVCGVCNGLHGRASII